MLSKLQLASNELNHQINEYRRRVLESNWDNPVMRVRRLSGPLGLRTSYDSIRAIMLPFGVDLDTIYISIESGVSEIFLDMNDHRPPVAVSYVKWIGMIERKFGTENAINLITQMVDRLSGHHAHQ